uniref:Carrier domain-containing protein n=1 Tax=Physcomitrium patens TaxID=3218 RepID=A0A2K1K798_PHYPA|nr:hypothetical protein PHYPA_011544 [Physcomitrium patens]
MYDLGLDSLDSALIVMAFERLEFGIEIPDAVADKKCFCPLPTTSSTLPPQRRK